jgi:hypothetical protein
VTSLTAIFGSSPEKEEQDSEKLLDLYWNRAELKKEFAQLREEKYRLGERIKHHEGATARVQQKLDHLENLLLDPEWVHNVTTFFQLRRLSMRCSGKIARFAEQLKQQREQRQQSQALVKWNESRKLESAAIEREVGEGRMRVQMLEDRLQSERHRLATMSGLWRLFRKRSLTRELDELAAEIDAVQRHENDLLAKLGVLQEMQPPASEGLAVASKRSINFMILSYAQQLYLHFADDELASLSKEAAEKSVGAVNYGGKDNCDFILKRINKRVAAMKNTADITDELARRAQLIADEASFSGDEDAVPVGSSMSIVFELDGLTVSKKRHVDLVGDNYWGLRDVLSR